MLNNLKTTYDETWLINTNFNGYLNDLFITFKDKIYQVDNGKKTAKL